MQVFQAIARSRHAGWYRESCSGACPSSGSRSYSFVELWDKYPLFLTRNHVSQWLSNVHVATKKSLSPGRKPHHWLCDLHKRQPSWRNWGGSCEGECCENYTWPDKSIAPLLYLAHTTPRQAVVLLHFGLFKEEDVSRLISKGMIGLDRFG